MAAVTTHVPQLVYLKGTWYDTNKKASPGGWDCLYYLPKAICKKFKIALNLKNKKQDHIQLNLEYILFYAPAIFIVFKMFLNIYLPFQAQDIFLQGSLLSWMRFV